jgi:hypothetical protein
MRLRVDPNAKRSIISTKIAKTGQLAGEQVVLFVRTLPFSQANGNFARALNIVGKVRFVDSDSAPTNMETQLFRNIKC